MTNNETFNTASHNHNHNYYINDGVTDHIN